MSTMTTASAPVPDATARDPTRPSRHVVLKYGVGTLHKAKQDEDEAVTGRLRTRPKRSNPDAQPTQDPNSSNSNHHHSSSSNSNGTGKTRASKRAKSGETSATSHDDDDEETRTTGQQQRKTRANSNNTKSASRPAKPSKSRNRKPTTSTPALTSSPPADEVDNIQENYTLTPPNPNSSPEVQLALASVDALYKVGIDEEDAWDLGVTSVAQCLGDLQQKWQVLEFQRRRLLRR